MKRSEDQIAVKWMCACNRAVGIKKLAESGVVRRKVTVARKQANKKRVWGGVAVPSSKIVSRKSASRKTQKIGR